jgi:hypothetical protein
LSRRRLSPVAPTATTEVALPDDWEWEAGLASAFTMRDNRTGNVSMANLIIEVPDHLVRSLAGIAAAQRKSVQQLALEQLSSLVEVAPGPRAGSPAAVLRAMQEPPHLSSADVDELDAVIAAGRLPIRTRDLFSD